MSLVLLRVFLISVSFYLECNFHIIYLLQSDIHDHTFGLKCNHSCSKCSTGVKCDHVTGSCQNGCIAGMYGDRCDKGILRVN